METVTISSPGARTAVVQRVGPSEVPPSERYAKVDRQEDDLTGQLTQLEESTRERNRLFEAKLCAIEQRARHLEEKMSAETLERETAHKAIMTALQSKLATAVANIEEWVNSDITNKFADGLQEQEERVEANKARVDKFIKVTIPGVIEAQSGAVTRKLQKAHETFDIENAKIHKREQKIMKRFEVHVRGTAQSIEDEKAMRQSRHWLLEEDMIEAERMDDRGEEVVTVRTMLDIKEVREDIAATVSERQRKDCLLLDSMLEAQQKLQACIIETFGVGQ
ncbi:hypothetical protein JKP88DRAFT_292970 [Tribonema minus]|uniref:Uncharacterized protein n=1 Tax=Tribonema minus TaxID=303371 RepID=A0A835ZDQ8_9STRA|nr:hypothetical protein JKP88DRAFT_292970 [Tribonema minus]